MRVELAEELVDVGVFEVVLRLLDLILVIDVAVRDPAQRPVGPDQVEHALDSLQVHGQALETVGDLAHHRPAVQAPDLLEVGELRNLHAIQPDFPAQAPGAEGRRFPVVLDETDVVHQWVEAHGPERSQVELDDVRWRRLDDDLVLVVVLQPERVVAVATVGRSPRRLHIGGAPGLRAECPEERGRVERAGAHFHVIGLQDHATAIGPVTLQRQQQVLERAWGRRGLLGHLLVVRLSRCEAAKYSERTI